MCLGVCDKSNSGGEAMTLLFLKTGEREREGAAGMECVCVSERERIIYRNSKQ